MNISFGLSNAFAKSFKLKGLPKLASANDHIPLGDALCVWEFTTTRIGQAWWIIGCDAESRMPMIFAMEDVTSFDDFLLQFRAKLAQYSVIFSIRFSADDAQANQQLAEDAFVFLRTLGDTVVNHSTASVRAHFPILRDMICEFKAHHPRLSDEDIGMAVSVSFADYPVKVKQRDLKRYELVPKIQTTLWLVAAFEAALAKSGVQQVDSEMGDVWQPLVDDILEAPSVSDQYQLEWLDLQFKKGLKNSAFDCIERLDGYLVGLLCLERMVMPNKWIGVLFAASPDDSQAYLERLAKVLQAWWNFRIHDLQESESVIIMDQCTRGVRAFKMRPWLEGLAQALNDEDPQLAQHFPDAIAKQRKIILKLIREFLSNDLSDVDAQAIIGNHVMGLYHDVFDHRISQSNFSSPAPKNNVVPFVKPEGRVGRNDPCPCGSGKKFKKCCK